MFEHPQFTRQLDNDRLLCTLCPRACELSDQQRGLCFIRQRQGDRIELTSYGRSSGFAIDPVEKKPLNHFFPGSSVLSFGTAGCNLSCQFCQSWDMSKSRQMDILQSPALPVEIAKAAKEHGCRSVAFTYNDPVIFYEYAVDTARACHDLDIKTIAVTAGYITDEARPGFFEHMDAANVDLKGFTESFYERLCAGSLAPVLDTLNYLVHETSVWTEITTLLIPGVNDSEQELEKLSQWVANELGNEIPLHFSAFHPDHKFLEHPATPHDVLLRAKQIAEQAGLNHVYLGNVRDVNNGSTYCPQCGKLLIERQGYEVTKWTLNSSGQCGDCGHQINGHFEKSHGTWGNQYQRIRI